VLRCLLDDATPSHPMLFSTTQQAFELPSTDSVNNSERSVVLPVGSSGLFMSARDVEGINGPVLVTGFRRNKTHPSLPGPAELSNVVRKGDCITHVNGVEIKGLKHLKSLLSGVETACITLRDSTPLERRKAPVPAEEHACKDPTANNEVTHHLANPHLAEEILPLGKSTTAKKNTPAENADKVQVFPFRTDWMWTIKLPVGEEGLLINAKEVSDGHVEVIGFRRAKNQSLGPAQLSRKIRLGDFITHFQSIRVTGMPHLVQLLRMQRGKEVSVTLHAPCGQPFPQDISLVVSVFCSRLQHHSGPPSSPNRKRKRPLSSADAKSDSSKVEGNSDSPKRAKKSPTRELAMAGFEWGAMLLGELANTPKKIKELVRRRLSGSSEKVSMSFAQARALFPDDLDEKTSTKLEEEIDSFFWNPES
jgi:hypothetical protein